MSEHDVIAELKRVAAHRMRDRIANFVRTSWMSPEDLARTIEAMEAE